MQQTALNLIAIGIFTITLSVLLGPIVHIPPTIPAVATFSIMGLATVDTLGWQGRGVTLLLDWLSGFSPEHRQRIIRHEAGHFLAAYFLGIPVTGYTLTAWEAMKANQAGLGGVCFDTTALSEEAMLPGEMRLNLDRFCTVWMAGIAAEMIAYGDATGGGDDQEKVRMALMGVGFSEGAYQQKMRWAQLQAKGLIEKYLPAYDALVQVMEQRASVEECCLTIQQFCQISDL
ncbi:MAG: ATP-dependent Zn protease [Chroococcales cyanobacterium]